MAEGLALRGVYITSRLGRDFRFLILLPQSRLTENVVVRPVLAFLAASMAFLMLWYLVRL